MSLTARYQMSALDRYADNLSNPKQRGEGAHGFIMSTANRGTIAGLPAQQIYGDLRRILTSKVSDQEITTAINKAQNHKGTYTPRPAPVIQDGKATLQKIIGQATITTEVDLWEASPIRLWDEPQRDMILLFETLYRDDDLITIRPPIGAGIIGQTIRPAKNWIDHYNHGGLTDEHIIPAPMTGLSGLTKEDKPSFQCDETVKTPYKTCVVEFDDLSRGDQIKFWSAVKLPILALIDSGGKSIHAWLDVQKLANVVNPTDWTTHIKGRLYDQILIPMGVDAQCSNPSRLSRLPGHYRAEKGAYQRLLWLSAEGKPICH
jgi:hypothetical protein